MINTWEVVNILFVKQYKHENEATNPKLLNWVIQNSLILIPNIFFVFFVLLFEFSKKFNF
jgi:hypothetical protein